MRSLVGGVLPHEVYRELQLPVRSRAPSFGLGLTSAAWSRHAAYLASVALTHPLLLGIFVSPSQLALERHPFSTGAHAAWAAQVHPENVLPFPDFEGRRSRPSASYWGGCTSGISPSCAGGRTHRRLLRLTRGPRRQGLGQLRPAPGLRTYIADRDFRVWLGYHCRTRGVALYCGATKG